MASEPTGRSSLVSLPPAATKNIKLPGRRVIIPAGIFSQQVVYYLNLSARLPNTTLVDLVNPLSAASRANFVEVAKLRDSERNCSCAA